VQLKIIRLTALAAFFPEKVVVVVTPIISDPPPAASAPQPEPPAATVAEPEPATEADAGIPQAMKDLLMRGGFTAEQVGAMDPVEAHRIRNEWSEAHRIVSERSAAEKSAADRKAAYAAEETATKQVPPKSEQPTKPEPDQRWRICYKGQFRPVPDPGSGFFNSKEQAQAILDRILKRNEGPFDYVPSRDPADWSVRPVRKAKPKKNATKSTTTKQKGTTR